MADETGKDDEGKSGTRPSGDNRPPWGRPVMDPTLINNGWTGTGDSRLPDGIELPEGINLPKGFGSLKRRNSNDE